MGQQEVLDALERARTYVRELEDLQFSLAAGGGMDLPVPEGDDDDDDLGVPEGVPVYHIGDTGTPSPPALGDLSAGGSGIAVHDHSTDLLGLDDIANMGGGNTLLERTLQAPPRVAGNIVPWDPLPRGGPGGVGNMPSTEADLHGVFPTIPIRPLDLDQGLSSHDQRVPRPEAESREPRLAHGTVHAREWRAESGFHDSRANPLSSIAGARDEIDLLREEVRSLRALVAERSQASWQSAQSDVLQSPHMIPPVPKARAYKAPPPEAPPTLHSVHGIGSTHGHGLHEHDLRSVGALHSGFDMRPPPGAGLVAPRVCPVPDNPGLRAEPGPGQVYPNPDIPGRGGGALRRTHLGCAHRVPCMQSRCILMTPCRHPGA